MEKVRTDVDEGGSGAYGGDGGSKPGEDEKGGVLSPELVVPPGNSIIDITV